MKENRIVHRKREREEKEEEKRRKRATCVSFKTEKRQQERMNWSANARQARK